MEGAAQADQGTPATELAKTAWATKQRRSFTLQHRGAPDWYWTTRDDTQITPQQAYRRATRQG